VNAVEFFVTVAASVTFIVTLGLTNWHNDRRTGARRAAGAPLGAWACSGFRSSP